MESSRATRILVVANRTVSTPRLLKEVERRARGGSCTFTLLIPDAPNRKAADWTLEAAIPLLERAARGKVEGLVGGPDPFNAVERAVYEGDFDEILVSTLPQEALEVVTARFDPPGRSARAARHGRRPATEVDHRRHRRQR